LKIILLERDLTSRDLWHILFDGFASHDSRTSRMSRREARRVEKQNAEPGLMPVAANEAAGYGYEAEDHHFV
jgi:hypothetical protein